MSEAVVTLDTLQQALRSVGLQEGDICLFHSSLRAFGKVEGGPQTFISAMEKIVGKEGTLVAPTLCQVDFLNSYKTWYMDKPSDVGYLTEYFRKLPYVYRSNQATHSVAARGKLAYELTWEHSLRGPHTCPFGPYAFSDGSPWAKMYERNAKVVFLGVSTTYLTLKHFVEIRFVEWALDQIQDPVKRNKAKACLENFENGTQIWPYYKCDLVEPYLKEAGLIRSAQCGPATILCVDAKEVCDFTLELLKTRGQELVFSKGRAWLQEFLQA